MRPMTGNPASRAVPRQPPPGERIPKVDGFSDDAVIHSSPNYHQSTRWRRAGTGSRRARSTCGPTAARVLPMFEDAHPDDARPRDAIEGGMAWVRDETAVGPVRELAFRAHAAAREAGEPEAVAAARSAGHAAAVAHMAGHARNAANYALDAIKAKNPDAAVAEDTWHRGTVPSELLRSRVSLRSLVIGGPFGAVCLGRRAGSGLWS
jgi:hypothetical protein